MKKASGIVLISALLFVAGLRLLGHSSATPKVGERALLLVLPHDPFAQLFSQRYGIDLRETGSGNVGATNVLRTVGVRVAIGVVVLDAAKGTAAVLIAQRIASGVTLPVAAALAAVIGHVYPVWLRFRGGKGVATAAGAFGVLTPLGLGLGALVFAIAVSAGPAWATCPRRSTRLSPRSTTGSRGRRPLRRAVVPRREHGRRAHRGRR